LAQAHLAAELLAQRPQIADPDVEADTIGRLIRARLTFLDASGRVVGDSEVDAAALPTLENHLTREEVIAARDHGEGTATRHSSTTGVETTYAAAAVRDGPVAFVRVALPLTAIDAHLARVRR